MWVQDILLKINGFSSDNYIIRVTIEKFYRVNFKDIELKKSRNLWLNLVMSELKD